MGKRSPDSNQSGRRTIDKEAADAHHPSHAYAARRCSVAVDAYVSAAALKAATGDGDGRTGTAALDDGYAAAQAARRGAVNIKGLRRLGEVRGPVR